MKSSILFAGLFCFALVFFLAALPSASDAQLVAAYSPYTYGYGYPYAYGYGYYGHYGYPYAAPVVAYPWLKKK